MVEAMSQILVQENAARRFLTYYLDTVGRILIQYVKFQEAGPAHGGGPGLPGQGARRPAQAARRL